MKFTKMHGIGNDYIYVNCFEEKVDNPEKVSIYVSDRRKGIGSDGLVLIMPSDKADFRMRIFNADGSEAMMCGNATRCIGKYVYDKGLTDKTEITLETNSGIKYLTLFPENGKVEFVEVDMGKAILTPKDIPVNSDKERFISEPVEVDGKEYKITCVSMGNPHAIVYMDDIKDLELEKIGPSFENHKLFPDRINTEFIEVIDSHTLNMRVWERGSGETFACGTGACASVVASVLNGYCNHDEEVTVHLRGGDLKITWNSDGTVIMKGPAALICDGDVDVSHIK
ncbi:diaminopimelate epimerase [Porcipelethomonas ammoniilytica]|uniref:diaminopimelate epimerase n=1 Tax=Porcipelethomonas ammoniilytica TaxID=2981722 RepID=UPI0008225091|nr:diaminopimelate epimerase [Porcipelethomonas ammoniilytica]MBS6314628.1 diaminopimelate epimerase [Ruminococcus sp.]MCU6719557.1 diaminopimelate epimerase [Porcipelethomonas ammoniilytica]SCI84886.1 Diaminopimelate epimerase [uncultured Ruminococcus sp.]